MVPVFNTMMRLPTLMYIASLAKRLGIPTLGDESPASGEMGGLCQISKGCLVRLA